MLSGMTRRGETEMYYGRLVKLRADQRRNQPMMGAQSDTLILKRRHPQMAVLRADAYRFVA